MSGKLDAPRGQEESGEIKYKARLTGTLSLRFSAACREQMANQIAPPKRRKIKAPASAATETGAKTKTYQGHGWRDTNGAGGVAQ